MPNCRVGKSATFAYADKKVAMAKSEALKGKIELDSNYEEFNSTGPEFFDKLMNPDNGINTKYTDGNMKYVP
jgi:hypothetical protein